MESVHPELWLIMDKFPGQSSRINELYRTDADFKTLCSDYLLCLHSLQEYQDEITEKQNTIKEYEVIRKDLERELQDFLGARK